MKLTRNEINRILETLPVGYYAKTKINVECSDGSGSYFDESNEKIVVGVDTINMGLEHVANDFNVEVAVRTVFYHEVSHLILTPLPLVKRPQSYARDLADYVNYYVKEQLTRQEAFDLINIVEDERIESALRNYYMNTNFRWFVLQQTHDGVVASTPREVFYSAVRFRKGNEKLLNAVSNIIIKYKGFTRLNSRLATEGGIILLDDYLKDIAQLYAMCVEVNKNESSSQTKTNEKDSTAKDTGSANASVSAENETEDCKEDGQGSGDQKDEAPDSDDESSKDDESEEEDFDEEPEEENDGTTNPNGSVDSDNAPEDDDALANGRGNPDETLASEDANQLFAQTFDGLRNDSMINGFRRIFKQFRTRGNVGGHTNAYSGVIDPRNITRKDYRYFTRTNTENNGGSGKLHLNLWIDCSGSYDSNIPVTNQIIKALEIVEKENKIFSFDVADINDGVNIHPKDKRYVKAWGGNNLCEEMDTKFKAMQKADSRNYNIVLYDGEAFCKGQQKLFSAWNHDNVYIISDTSNEKPITSNCKKAKTMFVRSYWGGKTYSQILAEKIYDILRVGFGA